MPSGASIAKLRREPLAADRIEDQVGAASLGRLAHAGDDIVVAIVERRLGAERQHRLPLRLRPGDADDPHAGDQRQLHRGAADPAGRGVHQHGLRVDPARAVCTM